MDCRMTFPQKILAKSTLNSFLIAITMLLLIILPHRSTLTLQQRLLVCLSWKKRGRWHENFENLNESSPTSYTRDGMKVILKESDGKIRLKDLEIRCRP